MQKYIEQYEARDKVYVENSGNTLSLEEAFKKTICQK